MNKLLVCFSCVFAIANVQAVPMRLTPADDSRLSALCVAAANSEHPLFETARSYGIYRYEINEVRCNGLSLDAFAARFKAVSSTVSKPLMFRKSDDSEFTELCFQALTSYDQYLQMLRKRTASDASLQSELVCNGMPVMNFVSRYRNSIEVRTASVQ